MRRILFIVLAMALAVSEADAQVIFKFSDGIYNESLKTKVEQNISTLLTNINKASRQGAEKVDLGGVIILEQAKKDFDDLWEYLPFKCLDDANVQSCIQTVTGYTVRGIPVIVTDKDTNEAPSVRELTIGFNSSGEITGIYFALEQHNMNEILQSGTEVKDVRQREEILNFVERYRSYYDQKDIKSIEEIFTDDAIIITGTVGMVKTKEGTMVKNVRYDELNKNQYIDKLRGIFRRNSYVKVKFTGAEVIAHPQRNDIYMVRLHQNWRTPGYEDNGYVTLLWQFPKNGGDPLILVRTWQDEDIVRNDEDQLFYVTDFKIE